MKRLLIGLMLLFALGGLTMAQDEGNGVFLPIGGGYTDTYPEFVRAVMARMGEGDNSIYLLVLPLAYSTDANQLSAEDLLSHSQSSEVRRRQLEEACQEVAGEAKTCLVVVAPIYTRELAQSPSVAEYFSEDLDGIYFLGGDQTTAMQVVMNTALEDALATAYAAGVVMGGNSAGMAIQSKAMIAGYHEGFDENSGFAEGAVDIWNSPERRGLSFGVDNVLLEQHFFEFVRLPRLVNAVVQADVPHIAIGLDGYTGAYLEGGFLYNLFGLYTGIVLDAQSLNAVASATYNGGSLSVRNVLVHMLAPSNYSYDTNTAQYSLAPTITSIDRSATSLAYTGAGKLILAGDAAAILATNTIQVEGSTVILAMNFADAVSAQAAIDGINLHLSGDISVSREIVGEAINSDLSSAQTIIVTSQDLSSFNPAVLAPVLEALEQGKTVLLDNAAAAVLGPHYSAHGETRESTEESPFAREEDVQGALLVGNTVIHQGLGIVNFKIEPRVISDARFGRMFALAYHSPSVMTIVLPDNAALELTSSGVRVLGATSIVTLDLSAASLGQGTNGGLLWANGLLDTFANGEVVSFASVGQ
jgi:cyanophycinase-like exopeptidase